MLSETLVAPTVTPYELETWPTTPIVDPHEEGVRHEAERLDRLYPGWHEKVNIETLNLGSCFSCILGQVHGYFAVPYGQVVLDARERGEGDPYLAAYGQHECEPAWIDEIEARRA